MLDLPLGSLYGASRIYHAFLLTGSNVEALRVMHGFVLDEQVDAFVDSELRKWLVQIVGKDLKVAGVEQWVSLQD